MNWSKSMPGLLNKMCHLIAVRGCHEGSFATKAERLCDGQHPEALSVVTLRGEQKCDELASRLGGSRPKPCVTTTTSLADALRTVAAKTHTHLVGECSLPPLPRMTRMHLRGRERERERKNKKEANTQMKEIRRKTTTRTKHRKKSGKNKGTEQKETQTKTETQSTIQVKHVFKT